MYLPPSAKSTNFKWESPILSSIDNDPLDNLVTLSMPCELLQDERGHTITLVNSDYPPVINLGNSRDGTGCLSLIGDGMNTSSTYCYLIGNDFLIDDTVNVCIEFWSKFDAIPSDTKLISNQSDDYINWSIEVNSTNNIQLVCGNSTGDTQVVILDSNLIELNTWKHHTFVKIDKSWKYFLNGIEQQYSQYTINMGYVPILPSNVILNMSFNSNISDDSGKTITVVGGAQLSTSIKKYGTSSLFLNGGYITTQSMNLASNEDFTLEFWVYPLSISSNKALIESAGDRKGIIFLSGGTLYWLGEDFITTGTLVINTWQHVALSRISSTLKIFLNGTLVGSGTSTQSQDFNIIGNDMYGQQLSGYFDDIRVTKGVGKYNTDFTPAALQSPVASNCRLNIGKPNSAHIRPLMYLDDIRITNSSRYLTNFTLDNSMKYLFTKTGIVYDKSGVPAKRLIRLYNRKTGNLVNETYSDDITGIWTLITPYPDTHFIVAHDNTGAINTSIIIDRV